MAAPKKPVAPKAPPETKTQKERFIDAARKAEASDDPKDFDRAFGRMVIPSTESKSSRRSR